MEIGTYVEKAVEHELSGRGIATLANTMGPFVETVLVDGADAGAVDQTEGRPALGRIEAISLPVRYAGTAVETVAISDAERLAGEVAAWIRGAP